MKRLQKKNWRQPDVSGRKFETGGIDLGPTPADRPNFFGGDLNRRTNPRSKLKGKKREKGPRAAGITVGPKGERRGHVSEWSADHNVRSVGRNFGRGRRVLDP